MEETFDQKCQSETPYSQQVAADHTPTTTSQPFDVLGHGRLSAIEWTLIIDKENGRLSAIEWTLIIDKETEKLFLHINELPNDASKHTQYFQVLGFSDNELCLHFTDVIAKIQEHTAGKTATPITQQRYLEISTPFLIIYLRHISFAAFNCSEPELLLL
jgi:hypothetical protein